jgi:hemoglobin-like flavoprotein
MGVPDQDTLAWDMLDAVRPALDIPAINRVSMTINSSDYPTVIEMLLAAAVDAAVPLSADIHSRLEQWLHFYSSHSSSVRLHRLLDGAKRDTGL